METQDTRTMECQKRNEKLGALARGLVWKKKMRSAAVVVVLLIMTFVTAWFYGRNAANMRFEKDRLNWETDKSYYLDRIKEMEETAAVAEAVNPKIIMDTISSEMGGISELATVEYLFTDAAKFSDSKQIKSWNIPFTEKSFTVKWNGCIKAGIKLEQVSVELIEDEKKILVTMPAAEILSYEVDQESMEVLDENSNVFNPISVGDKIKFDDATEKAMKERAIENGILIQGQKNGEEILERLMRVEAAVGTEYSIEFVH